MGLKTNWKQIINNYPQKRLWRTYYKVCDRLNDNPDDKQLYMVRDYIQHRLLTEEENEDKITQVSRQLEHEDFEEWRKQNSKEQVNEFYDDLIKDYERMIKEEENFEKYVRKEFIFKPEVLKPYTETSQRFRDRINTIMGDIRRRREVSDGKRHQAEVSDWFKRVRRDSMGFTQKTDNSNRG